MMMLSAINTAMPPKSDREPDLALTARVATGDPDASRELIFRVRNRVLDTCDYLVRKNDGADLAQLALMEVVRSAGSFRGESSLEYWVDRVTVQTAAKVFEKRDRRKRIRESTFVPGPESADVEQQAALGQIRRRLQYQLFRLSEKQRIVVVLHYLYDYEVPEMADLLGATLNAVKSRLRKGLFRLRKNILADPCLREWMREGKR